MTERTKDFVAPNNLKITVPSDSNWSLVIISIPFILVWSVIEIVIVPMLLIHYISFFTLVWTIAWTFAGLWAIRMLLWHTAGKTIIIGENNLLILKRKNDIFKKKKIFELSKIRNFTIENRKTEWTRFGIAWLKYKRILFTSKIKIITFSYNSMPISVIEWIDEAEAENIVSKLNSMLDQTR